VSGCISQAGAILHQQGLVDYLGHCSARIPGTDTVVIKPKHSTRTRSPEQLGGDDMSIINLDGELIEGSERPPAECFIHTEIYRARPDVNAVVHTHQPAATTLGLLDVELKPLLHVPAVLTDGANINTWPVSRLVTLAVVPSGSVLLAALSSRGSMRLPFAIFRP